ncbi:MAG: DUF2207 domain-containing protein [Candidatus Altiarchaeota archaeon]|nr:DUF2207 domain-containing protein [Candidatus Altiarchaeota archaeon]
MDNFQKTTLLILFPVALLVLFVGGWFVTYTPPTTSLSIDLDFQSDFVNVTELWIFYVNQTDGVFRAFPLGGAFSNMTIEDVTCQGEPIIAYDGGYQVACYGDFRGASILSLNYLLHQPYTCYDDVCYFESKMFEGGRVGPIEFTVSGANKFGAYPHPGFLAGEGVYEGEVSSGYFFAALPPHYSGTTFDGKFSKTFDNIAAKYSKETRLESNWLVNLLVLVSIEAFIAFLLFFIMGMEKTVYSTKHLSHPPSRRSPHLLNGLFFPDLPRGDVINATIVSLASRGYLEVTRNNMRLHPRQIHDKFEHHILHMLSKLAKNGVITLDRVWLTKRIKEIGKPEFKKLINELKKMKVCSKSTVNSIHDKIGDHIVLLMQGAFSALSFITYFLVPGYLVNYKTSLVILTLINLFWVVLSLGLGYTTFSRYKRNAATEKSLWLAYKRFVKSEVSLQKEASFNWNYALGFATLFGFENKVLKIAERKRIYFNHMYNARLATQAFGLIDRACH